MKALEEIKFCQHCNINPCSCDDEVPKYVILESDVKEYIEGMEISDEEIHDMAQDYNRDNNGGGQSFQDGAKRYKQQLKNRS